MQDNLIKFKKNDPRTIELAKRGAKAANKKRAERKKLKEELLILLAQGDTQSRISMALIEEALNGSVKAFETIRDTIGEKPVEVSVNKTIEDNTAFKDLSVEDLKKLAGE